MKIKQSFLYQLKDVKKAIIVYYIVIACLVVLELLLSLLSKLIFSGGQMSAGGFYSRTIIFLFVVGLCVFKENFRMLIQNGISRKTLFVGAVLTMLVIGVGMAVVDVIAGLLLKLGGVILDTSVGVGSSMETIWRLSMPGLSAVGLNFLEFILAIFSNIMALALGYVITLVYYRLSKMWKVIVSIGVPAIFIIVLPIIDVAFFSFNITMSMTNLLAKIIGNPFLSYGFYALVAVICFGCSYLLIHKAAIKNK